jgi:hypothetical protein
MSESDPESGEDCGHDSGPLQIAAMTASRQSFAIVRVDRPGYPLF